MDREEDDYSFNLRLFKPAHVTTVSIFTYLYNPSPPPPRPPPAPVRTRHQLLLLRLRDRDWGPRLMEGGLIRQITNRTEREISPLQRETITRCGPSFRRLHSPGGSTGRHKITSSWPLLPPLGPSSGSGFHRVVHLTSCVFC